MKTTAKKRTVDDEVSHVLDLMATLDPDSDEYAKAAKNLEMVCKARSYKNDKSISRELIAELLTSGAEIGAMLWFEKMNIITSKVLGRIWRSRQ